MNLSTGLDSLDIAYCRLRSTSNCICLVVLVVVVFIVVVVVFGLLLAAEEEDREWRRA